MSYLLSHEIIIRGSELQSWGSLLLTCNRWHKGVMILKVSKFVGWIGQWSFSIETKMFPLTLHELVPNTSLWIKFNTSGSSNLTKIPGKRLPSQLAAEPWTTPICLNFQSESSKTLKRHLYAEVLSRIELQLNSNPCWNCPKNLRV